MARRVRELVGAGTAYRDLSEFAEVAIANQLVLAGEDEADGVQSLRDASASDSALLRPSVAQGGRADADADATSDPLSPFTNRLFPVKLACRVLASCDPDTTLTDFQARAAAAARTLGRALRQEDVAEGRRALERRWVALPVGEKPSTLDRFINHFSIGTTRSGGATGPMAALGLAGLADGRPGLTDLGFELAELPNPAIDGVPGSGALDGGEADILVRAIGLNAAETAAIREFAEVVEDSGGVQAAVDASLLDRHEGWSGDQAAAHRAAMIGRLHDLALASVTGEGSSARISVAPLPPEFERMRA